MMGNITLRECRAEDVPALGALWKECFGDSDGFIEKFFAALPAIGGGVAAEVGGELAGAAYAVTAQELALPDGGARRVGYIYGVGVHERFRGLGLGVAVTEEAARLARAMGAELIATLPADEGLYGFYERTLGARRRLCRKRVRIAPREGAAVVRLDGAEYLRRREALLALRAHLRLDGTAMAFEEAMLTEYSGGLFAVGGGAAAAYLDGARAVMPELLLPAGQGGREREYAAAVCAALGATEGELLLPSPEGESYIAADGDIPPDCVWNLSFD